MKSLSSLAIILCLTYQQAFAKGLIGTVRCNKDCVLITNPHTMSQKEYKLFDFNTRRPLLKKELNGSTLEILGAEEDGKLYVEAYKSTFPLKSLIPGSLK